MWGLKSCFFLLFVVSYVYSSDHTCELSCDHFSEGCTKCTNTTFQCENRALKSVCAAYYNNNSTEMHTVDLRDNLISNFSSFPAKSNIKVLFIGNNHFTSLTKADMERFPLLEKLFIEQNEIKSLPKDVFEGSTFIEELHMSGLGLSELPDTIFKPLKALTFLDLSHNQLKKVPANTFQIGNRIRTLFLNGNPITELAPVDFVALRKIEVIHLGETKLTTITDHAFATLDTLREINFDHSSQLRFIDETAFGWYLPTPGKYAASLSKVSIRSCYLSNLDEHVFNVKGLEEFKFSNNPWECDCSIRWLMDPETWKVSPGKDKIMEELNNSKCDNDKWKRTPLAAVPLNQLECGVKIPNFKDHPALRLSSSLSTVTTIMIITLLVCCISVVLGILMFRRCTRQTSMPPAVNQYRAIYNQGHVQSLDEGLDKDAKSPYEL
ncbi:carboxypeptidase N subunit 2-like [Paramacrobiotus metropolitanus]|uniref:carboxypeptidase N subunit 2-like n=1 Tax=Paramacrobiotus metropolitanus TaxID=2943436 RepID=UPI0024465485|nr:carboxypeptidase N subunit 2-like [Paramacrobiotus metropolitanus]